jgi:hypothetical protein
MKDVYHYHTLTEWIAIHKACVDEMMRRNGFCAGFHYDLTVRMNTFQCNTLVDGEVVFPDASLPHPNIEQQSFSEAQAQDELSFQDNPYVAGGPREHHDPHTGRPKNNQPKRKGPDSRNKNGSQNFCGDRHRGDSYRCKEHLMFLHCSRQRRELEQDT